MSDASIFQAELISDDPRRESEKGVVEDLRDFIRASRDMRGLLTAGQAAKILDVNSGSINVWVRRGRLSSCEILGVQMVSAAEVLALHRQRVAEGVPAGGRGNKAPSIAVMAQEAWKDINPFGE